VKIPERFQLGGHTFTVREGHVFVERTDLYGQCDTGRNELRLAAVTSGGAPLARSVVEQAFFHELTHAIDAIFCNRKLTEDQTEQLAQGFYQVVRQMVAP